MFLKEKHLIKLTCYNYYYHTVNYVESFSWLATSTIKQQCTLSLMLVNNPYRYSVSRLTVFINFQLVTKHPDPSITNSCRKVGNLFGYSMP